MNLGPITDKPVAAPSGIVPSLQLTHSDVVPLHLRGKPMRQRICCPIKEVQYSIGTLRSVMRGIQERHIRCVQAAGSCCLVLWQLLEAAASSCIPGIQSDTNSPRYVSDPWHPCFQTRRAAWWLGKPENPNCSDPLPNVARPSFQRLRQPSRPAPIPGIMRNGIAISRLRQLPPEQLCLPDARCPSLQSPTLANPP